MDLKDLNTCTHGKNLNIEYCEECAKKSDQDLLKSINEAKVNLNTVSNIVDQMITQAKLNATNNNSDVASELSNLQKFVTQQVTLKINQFASEL
jgi:ribosomal protein L17